jgi:hypothetical protein
MVGQFTVAVNRKDENQSFTALEGASDPLGTAAIAAVKPVKVRSFYSGADNKRTGFAPPRAGAWRICGENPAGCLLRVRDCQIDGTARVAESTDPNCVGSAEQSG